MPAIHLTISSHLGTCAHMIFCKLGPNFPLTVHYVRPVELGIIPFNAGGVAAVLFDVILEVPTLVFIKDGKHGLLLYIRLVLKDSRQGMVSFANS